MNLPIITLEIQGMKHAIKTALIEHAVKMDSSIQQAVEEYCTEENINQIIKKTASDALDAAIKEEIRHFFQYSQTGRLAVREAVNDWLNLYYSVKESDD